MPRVSFTSHLRRHLNCETIDVGGATVAAALEDVFREQPELRGYLLDDQGQVRQHVMIFVDDRTLADRQRLSDPLRPDSQVFVMQALSGG
jgi:molybdopterin converting factor small subunit